VYGYKASPFCPDEPAHCASPSGFFNTKKTENMIPQSPIRSNNDISRDFLTNMGIKVERKNSNIREFPNKYNDMLFNENSYTSAAELAKAPGIENAFNYC
jgi:hypothetical protein